MQQDLHLSETNRGSITITLPKTGSLTISKSLDLNKKYKITGCDKLINCNTHRHSLKKYDGIKHEFSLKERYEQGFHDIILMTRNVIDRNISYFIHRVKTFNKNNKNRTDDLKLEENDYIGNKSINIENKKIEEVFMNNHSIQDEKWYLEFFDIIDFDFKKESFDRDKGFQVYNLKNNNKLFIIRLEKLNDNKEELCSLLKIKNIKNINQTTGYSGIKNKLKSIEKDIERKNSEQLNSYVIKKYC